MFWKSTVNLGFKLRTEQLQIVKMFWQVFSLDICLDKSMSMDTNTYSKDLRGIEDLPRQAWSQRILASGWEG
jgi:hypothetical protein